MKESDKDEILIKWNVHSNLWILNKSYNNSLEYFTRKNEYEKYKGEYIAFYFKTKKIKNLQSRCVTLKWKDESWAISIALLRSRFFSILIFIKWRQWERSK